MAQLTPASPTITDRLRELKLDLNNCVAQCYDGASVMSGRTAGVQSKLREIQPSCLYVHCYAHRLNLVLVDTCKSIASVADFFGILQATYVFLASRSSKRHAIFVDAQKAKGLSVMELKRTERHTLGQSLPIHKGIPRKAAEYY